MEAIFNAVFLILCAFLLQGMVLASDDSLESSSDPHIRQKRMNPATPAPPGSLPSHQLPPFLAYNLHAVNIDSPTVVVITRNGNIFGTGYAIHPYLVLTVSVFARPQYVTGVSTRHRIGEGHVPRRVKSIFKDPTGEYVIIQLYKPIFLDEPVHGALPAAKYPTSAINWAHHAAMQWIPGLISRLRPLLRQNLNEVNFLNPLKVSIFSSERPSIGTGYAVHPYIVITRPEFVTRNSSVLSSISASGETWDHRLQSNFLDIALNVDVIELLDPILLTNGETNALTADHYSAAAIEWARAKAEEWKRTRLNQRNYYQENAA